MKAKSMKLRTIITLYALFKHSDKDHRLNGPKLNKFLKPYGLNCTSRVLSDTVRVMQEYGIDVRYKGEWDSQGVWIEDRPLSNADLDRVIFAITTNPHLSNYQMTDILNALKPLVTVYDEDKLTADIINTVPDADVDDMLFVAYSLVKEAVIKKRRVVYTTQYVKYNKKTQTVSKQTAWDTVFTPCCIYQSNAQLYMVGYNNTDRRIEAVNLKNITDIKLSFKHQRKSVEETRAVLDTINVTDYIPEEKNTVIYSGDIVFQCKGQFTEDIYARFGPPSAPVIKDNRCKTTYTVSNAQITPQTLLWLAETKNKGIIIKGPYAAIESVKAYCDNLFKSII